MEIALFVIEIVNLILMIGLFISLIGVRCFNIEKEKLRKITLGILIVIAILQIVIFALLFAL